VSISQITSYGTNPVSAAYLVPTQSTNRFTNIAPAPPSNADTVHLSGSALARSLRLQGYSVEGIAAKLGTSVRIVDQYLNVAVSGANNI
jgi:hypothetical protein